MVNYYCFYCYLMFQISCAYSVREGLEGLRGTSKCEMKWSTGTK